MKKLIAVLFLLFTVIWIVKCSDDSSPSPTPPEFEHARGFVKDWPENGLVKGADYLLADRVSQLPIHFSWPVAGFDIPVYEQGHCGSCWAFSSVENLEWSALIFLGKSLVLSKQELVGKLFGGCGGGYFAGSYEVKNGVVLESDCPYKANNSKCKSGLKPAVQPPTFVNIGDGHNEPSLNQLKEAILEYGPLSVDVAAGGDWDGVGANEVISGHNQGINHMVIIYGWDDAKGVWQMRNSWGKDWGNEGSAMVKYGADRIASDASTVLTKPLVEYNQWKPNPKGESDVR